MNDEIQAALESALGYYSELCDDMHCAIITALRDGEDFEFDTRVTGRFLGAIEWLAESVQKAKKEAKKD